MSFKATFPGFKLRLTRWGGVFLGAVLVLGMAAVNTGNNSLVGLLAFALGSYVVAGAWSRQVLGRVSVEVRPPAEIFAGQPTVVEVELENSSRLLPAYGLVLTDGEGRPLLLEPLLPAAGRRRHTIVVEMPRRGWCPLGPWRLEVLMPLGFFVKSKDVVRDQQVLVYPRLLPSGANAERRRGRERAEERLVGRGREGEVTQLRNFHDGDERRQIHWKQTARQERLVVVERQRQARVSSYVVVDPRAADPDDPVVRRRFERLVSQAATTVVSRLRRDEAVGLVLGGAVIRPVSGIGRGRALLRALAEVELERLELDQRPPRRADLAETA
jgi:uncharacterized protein (DUF58 family)